MVSDDGFAFDLDNDLVICPIYLRCGKQHDWQLGIRQHGESLFLLFGNTKHSLCFLTLTTGRRSHYNTSREEVPIE